MPTNLITNGTFNTNTSGWTLNGNGGFIENSDWNTGTGKAIIFGGGEMPGGASISQTIATEAGKIYNVEFQYGAGAADQAQAINVHATSGGVTVLDTNIIDPHATWTASEIFDNRTYGYSFTAAGSTTTLSFTDKTGLLSGSGSTYGTDGVLDNVSVTAAVVPNLITNGTFNTDTSGWTLNTNGGFIENVDWNTGTGKAIIFGGGEMPGGASISQTIATHTGRNYTVEFQYGAGAADQAQAINLQAMSGSTSVLNVNVIDPHATWTASEIFDNRTYGFTFTAGGGNATTLNFTDKTGLLSGSGSTYGTDGVLDNVLVTAVPNLVSNGDFNAGTGDWTVNSNGGMIVASEWGTAPGKTVSFGGGEMPGGASISQTIATETGRSYTIEFQYGAAGADQAQAINVHATSGGIAVLDTNVIDPHATWNGSEIFDNRTYGFTFTAAASSTTLSFTDKTGLLSGSGSTYGSDALLDNVWVSAVY